MALASGGKVSPAQRQISGDREHLGRRIPQPGACCHLRASPCSELTFLFYHPSSDSSPPLCRCRRKLVYRKKTWGSRCDGRDGKLIPEHKQNPWPHSIYAFELSFFCSRPDSGCCSPAPVGEQWAWWAPHGQDRCFLWSHGGSADPRYHGREEWHDNIAYPTPRATRQHGHTA